MAIARLFGFLVLCSSLAGCVTIDTRDQLRVGMSKSELREISVLTTTINDDPFISPVSEWSADQQVEILYAEGRKYFYVFTDVTQNTSGNQNGNGKFDSVHTSIAAARQKVKEILQERQKAIDENLKRDVVKGKRMQKTVTKKKRIGPLE